MAENFYTLLTMIGKNKLSNSVALEKKINFKTLKVGDGKGAYYEPSENQTSLMNEVWTGNVSSISIEKNNSNWIVVETVIPATDGGFFIREAGIFDETGDLIAVSKLAETYKPIVSEGSTKDLVIKIVLEVLNVNSVTLKIDPNVVVATKSDMQVLESKIRNVDAQLSEGMNILTPTSGSTANAILLGVTTFTNNKKYSFKATAASTGNVTINGKAFKKLDGTQIGSGGVKANKVYDFYYDSTSDYVFILAKAVGTATVASVLAPFTFSNGDDIELTGTITSKAAATYNPSTVAQTIAAGQYLSGIQTISAITGTAVLADVLATKTFSSANGIFLTGTMANNGAVVITPNTVNQVIPIGYHNGAGYVAGDADLIAANIISGKDIFGIAGSATIASLGGKKVATGSAVFTSNTSTGRAFTTSANNISHSDYVTGSGLSFTPSTIIMYFPGNINAQPAIGYYSSLLSGSYYCLISLGRWNSFMDSEYGWSQKFIMNSSNVYYGGFVLPVINPMYNWTYIAIE